MIARSSWKVVLALVLASWFAAAAQARCGDWSWEPRLDGEECANLPELPPCRPEVETWVRAFLQLGDDPVRVDQATRRWMRDATTCWLRSHGFLGGGGDPCLCIVPVGRKGGVWVLLVRAEDAARRWADYRRGEDLRRRLERGCPAVIEIYFYRKGDRLAWGDRRRRESGSGRGLTGRSPDRTGSHVSALEANRPEGETEEDRAGKWPLAQGGCSKWPRAQGNGGCTAPCLAFAYAKAHFLAPADT